MNFLAHAYLSFGHPQVLAGNMISDFVKGKARYSYPALVQHGIALHRMIDAYTDAHKSTKEAQTVFRPAYRLYSGPIVDIVFDHFLANDQEEFSIESLHSFTASTYQLLEEQAAYLPQRFLAILPFMKMENWLYHYKDKEGIAKSLQGLVRRSSFLSDHQTAVHLFNEHYPFLQQCYSLFFKDVKKAAKQMFNQFVME